MFQKTDHFGMPIEFPLTFPTIGTLSLKTRSRANFMKNALYVLRKIIQEAFTYVEGYLVEVVLN